MSSSRQIVSDATDHKRPEQIPDWSNGKGKVLTKGSCQVTVSRGGFHGPQQPEHRAVIALCKYYSKHTGSCN